jgi:WD40 repeat protein
MDLSRGVELRRFDLPGALVPRDEDAPTPLAMLSDGSRIAAPVRVEGGKPMLIVWDGLTGAMLRRFEAECRCAAFSPDGAYVAGGDAKGQGIVWSLGTGLPVAKLNAGNRINVLMFGRNPRFSPDGPGAEPALRHWQLAAGDGGGNVTVWDLGWEIPRVRSIGRGSYNEVFALSFSPDGALLGSAGRLEARLWDPATGSLLLSIEAGQYQYGLTFSPDGRRLAIGSEAEWQNPGGVQILDLVDGRGVRTLRGLSGWIEAPVLSPDDSHVAALSHDWRVGIWERATGRLKLVLDVPPGLYQTDAGLAFSPDNRLIAFSSDRWAGLWEIESGRLLKSWPLPVGLQDKLSFQGQDHLILARAETIDPSVAPYGGTDCVKYPRYCAIYDLLNKDSREPKRKIREPNLGIQSVALLPGGSAVVIDGLRGTPDRKERSIDLFGLPTGSKKWGLPMRSDEYWQSSIAVDPTGTFMKARQTKNAAVLIDAPSGRSQDFDPTYAALGPGARLVIGGSNEPVLDLLVERGRETPLLAIDAKTTPIGLGRFTKNGLFVVGASPLGDSVSVCDLAEIQQRLTRIGLGW